MYADTLYYRENNKIEKKADFEITEYQLSMSVKRNLSMEAIMVVSNKTLHEYCFTLYHGYTVFSVVDEEDNVLNFSQKGDYLTVYSNPNNLIKYIKIKYRGSSPRYYSNEQGICLPGFFPYYPRPGFYKVFDVESASFVNDYPSSNSLFNILVKKCNVPVFSNLREVQENTFAGDSEAVTIVAGLYDTVKIQNIEIVFPYTDPIDGQEDTIRSNVLQLINEGRNINSIAKIIVVPSLNQISDDEQYCIFSDYMTARQIFMIDDAYNRISVPKEKRNLYYLVKIYERNPLNLDEYISLSIYNENDNLQANMFKSIVGQFDWDVIYKQCYNYLYDISDNRSVTEFLNDIQIGGDNS